MTVNDDFWLYDFQINPMNCPCGLVFSRSDKDPEEMLQYFYDRMPSDCIYYKYVKIFGKYFKSPLTEEEKKEHRKKNTGVLYDVKNDKDASDVLIKLKKLTDKFSPIGSARVYYVPELNENESALICYGHHSLMDGFSVW